MRYIFCLLVAVFSYYSYAETDEPNTIQHYQIHPRYQFGLEVLKLTLSKIDKSYELIEPEQKVVNEARGEWKVISGELDIQWMSTTVKREEKLIPIRIPIYRGVLGLRLLLVTHANKQTFAEVKTISQLAQFVGGHGAHWGDLPVYEANGLPVKSYGHYDTLFLLLKNKRFDYFHRGVNEIWKELESREDALTVADHIVLFYPHPVYFFVSKSRPLLAQDLEQGLNRALKDGSYEALFRKFHQADLDRAELNKRHLIRLKNPVNPAGTPPIDTSWWLPDSLQISKPL